LTSNKRFEKTIPLSGLKTCNFKRRKKGILGGEDDVIEPVRESKIRQGENEGTKTSNSACWRSERLKPRDRGLLNQEVTSET